MIKPKKENRISIELFKKYFLGGVTKNGKYVKYSKNKDFTELVKVAMAKLGKECDLKYLPEFYKVDHTFWENDPSENVQAVEKVGMKKNHNWNLLALIEHENDNDDWHYEVQKLAPFCCPLRIVVGYRNTNYPDEKRLECVSLLLNTMKENRCFCENGEFWIVIGNTGHDIANYIFYRYDAKNNRFEKCGGK